MCIVMWPELIPLSVVCTAWQDEYIRSVLGKVKTIAMIGASANWKRPSYFAMSYLQVCNAVYVAFL